MRKSVETLRDDLQEHPAVHAWRALDPESVEPDMIDVLKQWKGNHKSGVYRLSGVGPDGSAVIAKRCSLRAAAVERPIYEQFLPRLSLARLNYYGSVEEPDGQSCWLFLGEAGGEFYSPQNRVHRALAARWLAAVHNASQSFVWKTSLPDRSPKQYLQLLHFCVATLAGQFGNPDLPPKCEEVLERLCQQCDLLERHWDEVEEICQALPQTLVHGDFVASNLMVRSSAEGPELLVFDWEFAGWGAPALDLAQKVLKVASPDLAVYRLCLEQLPKADEAARIQKLAACGGLFRLIESVYWTCADIMAWSPKFLIKPISVLEACSQSLVQPLNELGWAAYD